MRFFILLLLAISLSACSFPWQEKVDDLKAKTEEKIDQVKDKVDEVKEDVQDTKESLEKKLDDIGEAVDKIGEAKDAIDNIVSSDDGKEEDTANEVQTEEKKE